MDLLVELPDSPHVSVRQHVAYTRDAVASWGGGFPADHPQFQLYRHGVRVVPLDSPRALPVLARTLRQRGQKAGV